MEVYVVHPTVLICEVVTCFPKLLPFRLVVALDAAHLGLVVGLYAAQFGLVAGLDAVQLGLVAGVVAVPRQPLRSHRKVKNVIGARGVQAWK